MWHCELTGPHWWSANHVRRPKLDPKLGWFPIDASIFTGFSSKYDKCFSSLVSFFLHVKYQHWGDFPLMPAYLLESVANMTNVFHCEWVFFLLCVYKKKCQQGGSKMQKWKLSENWIGSGWQDLPVVEFKISNAKLPTVCSQIWQKHTALKSCWWTYLNL